MTAQAPRPPTVMVFAGLDPTGGAGLQADIESIASLGAHALPVITAVTAQDTRDVRRVAPVDVFDVVAQARAVMDDIPVAAFKLGVLGSVEIVQAVHTMLGEHRGKPVVLDPVCAAGGGASLADDEQIRAVAALLVPAASVITPNTLEARRLAGEADSLAACAQQLMSDGAGHVLLTGGHEPGPEVVNRLYGEHRLLETYRWPRLPYECHGSGCTLAAALAALLAHGLDVRAAAARAQEFTWRALRHARALGSGQRLPDRLHWAGREPSP